MADYQLEGPKAARMYEVILPKKLGYFGKVQEVLEDLFDEEAIRAVPFVRQSIARSRRRDPRSTRRAGSRPSAGPRAATRSTRWTAAISRATGPVDERVLVIRFIFHNPGDEADPKTDFLAASLEVVNHLVAHRFAAELGVEEEIWFLEYNHPQLAIWRKDRRRGAARGGPADDQHSPVIDRYAAGGPMLVYAASGLTPEQEMARPGPGAWSIAELVAHLLDADLVLADRMKRVIAEEDPVLLAFDENAWIERLGAEAMPVEEAVNLFAANRHWMTQILRRCSEADFARAGQAHRSGPADPGRDPRHGHQPPRPPPPLPLRQAGQPGRGDPAPLHSPMSLRVTPRPRDRSAFLPVVGRVPSKLEWLFINEISALVNDGFGPDNPCFLIELRLVRRFSPVG